MKRPLLRGRGFIATGNKGKLKEIIPLCEEYFELEEVPTGLAPDGAVESESTFEGNALIKAEFLKNKIQDSNEAFWILSDDSGLSVENLNGAPGVHSARYAGDHVGSEEHMAKLIHEIQKTQKPGPHKAHYTCALCLITNTQDSPAIAKGECHGEIILNKQGQSGFGYDPIFYSPEFKKTFAEISYEEKNSISHRRKAFEELQKILLGLSLILLILFSPSAIASNSNTVDFASTLQNLSRQGLITIPVIPPSIAIPAAKTIETKSADSDIKTLIELYEPHLKDIGKNQKITWQVQEIGAEKHLPSARPNNIYFNTTIIRALVKDKEIAIFRPVDTTTGCLTGCAPVTFHLQFLPNSRELKLISDPTNPLQKIGHAHWTNEDIKKTQNTLKKIPSWMQQLASPAQTTHNDTHQTWPLYSDTLVTGAAYTSYRIYEAAIQTLEFFNDPKNRSQNIENASNLLGEVYRIKTIPEAHNFWMKLQAPQKSYLEEQLRAALASSLLIWLFKNDPKFSSSELQKKLQSPLLKNLVDYRCLVLEESLVHSTSALKLSKADKKIWAHCPNELAIWSESLAKNEILSNLQTHLQTNLAIPQFLERNPERFQTLLSSLNKKEQKKLQIKLVTHLKALYPRLNISLDYDKELLEKLNLESKKQYLNSISPPLGPLPSLTLNKMEGTAKIPAKGKVVYIFFASWCPHCKTVLEALKNNIKDPKTWSKIQLVETLSQTDSIFEAQIMCGRMEIPEKICDDMLLLPRSQSQKIQLTSVPKIIVTNSEGQIIDFDFKLDHNPLKDPLQNLLWILEN